MSKGKFNESLHPRDKGKFTTKPATVDTARGTGNADYLRLDAARPADASSAPAGYSDVTSRVGALYSAFGELRGGQAVAMGSEPQPSSRQYPAGGFSSTAQQAIYDANEEEQRKRNAPKPQASGNMLPPNDPPNFPPSGGNNGKDNSKYSNNSLTVDDWEDKYAPSSHPTDPDAPWGGTMLETYGADLEHVHNADPHTVWTLVDVEGKQYILNGYHTVNRFGYFITKEKWNDGDSYTINVD